MRMDDLARQAWRPLWTYKLRTTLSLLGILIGVAAVIALITLMQSASASVGTRIEGLGSNLVVVTMNPLVNASNSGRDLTLREADRLRALPGIQTGAPVDYETTAVTYGHRQAATTVYASNPVLTQVLQYHLAFGRYLTRVDQARHLNVVVLGAQTSTSLFGHQNPVGRTVTIDGQPDVVVGVLAAKGAFFNVNQDSVAMVPLTTYRDVHAGEAIDSVYLRTHSTAELPMVVHELSRELNSWVGGSDRYTVMTQSQILNLTQEIAGLLTQVLVGVAAISIVVGGIGMLNVLVISVSERVREIGVRKSLGARRMDLLLQFLLESVLISFAGGVLGVALGIGISWGITHTLNLAMVLSPVVPAGALAASIALGVVFGLYPALRASRLAPAVALRCE